MSHPLWKTCAGFPNYQISQAGLIRRAVDGRTRKAGDLVLGCQNNDGYLVVKLTGPKGKSIQRVHRLVALTFLGNPPTEKHHAAHNDGNPLNNHVDNLRWATPKENCGFDRRRHGRTPVGVRNGRATLNEQQVRSIRKEYQHAKKVRGGLSRLAEKYGVQPSTIYNAAVGIRWGHLDAE